MKKLNPMKVKWDQYGDPVPTDLVAMLGPEDLYWFSEVVDAIRNLPWYEVENILCISHSALQASLDSQADVLLGFTTWKIKSSEPIYRVDDCLKRYSYKDGFYHA
jgi:hypothetical protein